MFTRFDHYNRKASLLASEKGGWARERERERERRKDRREGARACAREREDIKKLEVQF